MKRDYGCITIQKESDLDADEISPGMACVGKRETRRSEFKKYVFLIRANINVGILLIEISEH